MKFSIGDKVVEKESIQPHTSINILEVAGILNGDLLAVHYGTGFQGEVYPSEWEDKPGSKSWRSALHRYQEVELFSLDEALKEQLQMEVSKDKLDSEFEKVQREIQEKLNKAATLVQEADALAKPFGRNFFQLKSECLPLYHALHDGGWSHSHMSC